MNILQAFKTGWKVIEKNSFLLIEFLSSLLQGAGGICWSDISIRCTIPHCAQFCCMVAETGGLCAEDVICSHVLVIDVCLVSLLLDGGTA